MTARRILGLLLLVQALAAGLIAWGAAGLLDLAPALALVFGVACVILVRAAISANNFVVSRRHASATPAQHRLGPGQRARLFAEEFTASMLHSSWHMPRGRAPLELQPSAWPSAWSAGPRTWPSGSTSAGSCACVPA